MSFYRDYIRSQIGTVLRPVLERWPRWYAVISDQALLLLAAAIFLVGSGTLGLLAQNAYGLYNFWGRPPAADEGSNRYATALQSQAQHGRHHHRHRLARRFDNRPGLLRRQVQCVRLCDGYFFPVGSEYGWSDLARSQKICHATFPESETKLFVLPKKSEKIADAVAVNDGTLYAALPTAFNYTKPRESASSCRPQDIVKSLLPTLEDFTLHRGDIVMTAQGFRIFHGAEQAPHRPEDFVSLREANGLNLERRNMLVAMESVSIVPGATQPTNAGHAIAGFQPVNAPHQKDSWRLPPSGQSFKVANTRLSSP